MFDCVSDDAVQRLQLKSQPSALVSTSTEETDEKHNVVNIGIPTPARRQVKTFYHYDKNGNATQIIKDYQGVDVRLTSAERLCDENAQL